MLSRDLAAVASEWELIEIGPPFAGSRASFVAPARRGDGAELVLKLVPKSEWVAFEARALAHWAGRGAARLEAVDWARGALLLERVVPGDALAAWCQDDDRAATEAAANVMVRLGSSRAPIPDDLPRLGSWVDRLHGINTEISGLGSACREAGAVAAELLGDAGPEVVLHGDLHHGNVLRAEREPWLAVDPKGLVGPPAAESAALLRNPRGLVLAHPDPAALLSDRVDVLAERLGTGPRLIAGWGYVLAVAAAAWAWEDREGEAEVGRWLACAAILQAVARRRGIG